MDFRLIARIQNKLISLFLKILLVNPADNPDPRFMFLLEFWILMICVGLGSRIFHPLVALLNVVVLAQQNGSAFQRYYAMMEKKSQVDTIARNQALMFDASAMSEAKNIKTQVQQQFDSLRSSLEIDGADSFKSCADINNNRLSIFGEASLKDGIYIIFIDKKAQQVYCDMTTLGGGFTLVRRVSTSGKWWPMDDNFSGKSHGTYDANLAFASEVVFGLDYRNIPRSRVLISTGDKSRWALVDQKSLTEGFGTSCDASVQLLASSKSSEVLNVKWCKRNLAEDPWVSLNDHFHKGSLTESEEHSMLWGESSFRGWNLWKDTHNGINVFIR